MRILCVEDSKFFRKVLSMELASLEAEIIFAQTWQEVLCALEEKEFDLITMDITLPKESGMDISQKIRFWEKENKRSHPMPILFITDNDGLEDRKLGVAAGGTDFMTKCFGEGELSFLVSKLVNKHSELNGFKVMVVDDSQVSLMITSNFIKKYGAEIISFTDPQKALEHIEQNPQEIDMLITDLHMPGLDGGELCKKVRQGLGLRTLPIIILTGEVDREKLLELFKFGMTDYIAKPFISEEIESRIIIHLENRRFIKAA